MSMPGMVDRVGGASIVANVRMLAPDWDLYEVEVIADGTYDGDELAGWLEDLGLEVTDSESGDDRDAHHCDTCICDLSEPAVAWVRSVGRTRDEARRQIVQVIRRAPERRAVVA